MLRTQLLICRDAGMLAELESVWARGGCVLCDSADFEREGFGRQTVLICDQCEREFHVGCLHDHNMAELSELPKGVCPEGAQSSCTACL